MSRRAGRHLSTLPPVSSSESRQHRLTDLISAMSQGDFDDELQRLYRAVADRLETVHAVRSATALLALETGDRVELNDRVRPNYLRGSTGTVMSLTVDQVVVALDRPIGRFRAGQLRCSPLTLEKLDAPIVSPADR